MTTNELKKAEKKLEELMVARGKARHTHKELLTERKKNRSDMSEEEKAEINKNVEAAGKALDEATVALQKHSEYIHRLRRDIQNEKSLQMQGRAFVTAVSMQNIPKKMRGKAVAMAQVAFSNGLTRHIFMNNTGHWVGNMPIYMESTQSFITRLVGSRASKHEMKAVLGGKNKFNQPIQWDYTQDLRGDLANALRELSFKYGHTEQGAKAA